KAKELVQEYVRREPDAVTLVNELLTDAGVSMDTLPDQGTRRQNRLYRADRAFDHHRRDPPRRRPARDRPASRGPRQNAATRRARDRGRRLRGRRVSARAAASRREKRGLTSERKIRANRANARASTGPQTTRGRARAAKNALRHPVGSIPALSEEVETLAGEIAGPAANAETQDIASHVAEAHNYLRRVRYARNQFLYDNLSMQYYDSYANMRMRLKVQRAILRPNPPDMSIEPLKFATSRPQGPHKLATILSGEAKKLLAMDRYERRALSRRKFAIRAFD